MFLYVYSCTKPRLKLSYSNRTNRQVWADFSFTTCIMTAELVLHVIRHENLQEYDLPGLKYYKLLVTDR